MARGDRSVDVFVRKLRQKLEQISPGWRYVHTHFGVGYRFAAEPIDGDDGAGEKNGSEAVADDERSPRPVDSDRPTSTRPVDAHRPTKSSREDLAAVR
jgi:DNA-binding winged helix-turn-helix (wHTH) protein